MRLPSIILLLVVLGFTEITSAQTIYGRVFDTNKEKPLSGATVYLNGTTMGTITDFEGNFLIETDSYVPADLVVSYLGYTTQRIDNPYRSEVLEVVLVPNKDELKEVVVKRGKGYWTREKMLEQFKRQFLGWSKAGDLCIILNEDDLDLWMDVETKSLFASSDVPIMIRNNYLGYTIEYKLNSFEAQYTSLSPQYPRCIYAYYEGESFYQDLTKNPESLVRFREKRVEQYFGSVTHFFRSLFRDELRLEGFELGPENFPLSADKCFHKLDLDNKAVVLFKRNFLIRYKNQKPSLLFKEKLGVPIEIYPDGNYTPLRSVRFDGYLSDIRMGRTLPLDYDPENKEF